MDFMTLAKERYSVRDYKETPIEEKKLQKILEAGWIAPTAKNNQAYRVYVLKSEAAIAKIRELTRCAFNAPIVLLFTHDAAGTGTGNRLLLGECIPTVRGDRGI